MKKKDELIRVFAASIQAILQKLNVDYEKIHEIRLRTEKPLIISYSGKEIFLSSKGELCSNPEDAYTVTRRDIAETMEYIGSYSLYAYEDELKQGFLTIQGGHRVGIAGRAVVEGNNIRSIKYISFINVRLSHQVRGCADPVVPYLYKGKEICHTLIISPPRCGKTTLLRDIVRQLSDGSDVYPGVTVGVVDERSEIGGAYLGIPQNDLGIRTDLLDCCPKAQGMMMMVRSMSPNVICVDEIGDSRDMQAIEAVIHCGCKLIATVHGYDMDDISRKPLLQQLVKEKTFQRYILLKERKVHAIFDERGTNLFMKEDKIC